MPDPCRRTLIAGPPASGKSHLTLEAVREALRSGQSGVRLLVPTATMAEHLRNQLAREGLVFQPDCVSTLARFLETWTADLTQVSGAALEIVTQAALARLAPAPFAQVAGLPGFHSLVARLVDEVSWAGCDARRLAAHLEGTQGYAAAFSQVYGAVEQEMSRRGWLLRGGWLARVAARLAEHGPGAVRSVFLDGFFSFSPPEIQVVEALARHAHVTVTLPGWEGAARARRALVRAGFAETVLVGRRRREPRVMVVEAPNLAREAEEIARRIVEEAGRGRPFREMGIVLRSAGAYEPALRSALGRFGVPARFYFGATLARLPVVRYLSSAVEAMLGGWDQSALLEMFEMPASGLGGTPAGDRLAFELGAKLPGQGLAGFGDLSSSRRLTELLGELERLEGWRRATATPGEWAARARTLRALHLPAPPAQPATHEMAAEWRAGAYALEAFDAAMEDTAQALDSASEMSFADFWPHAGRTLQLTVSRVPDRRRDVVHVVDAYEARQWELPVVFVCGLLEREFPRHHPQHPLLPDHVRRHLSERGVPVRTSEELDGEERFLFDLATTRASSLLVLSYARHGLSGEPALPSFLLDEYRRERQPETVSARPARPRPERAAAIGRTPRIYDEALRGYLREKHRTLSPTAIETFLECPFRFFAEQTLRLEGAPALPEERLDLALQGSILHQALAEWAQGRPEPEEIFARLFEAAGAAFHIPPGHRREALRLEMFRNFQRFVQDTQFPGGWPRRAEQSFEMPLGDDLTIRGKIDRLDEDPAGEQAIVVDYKYSRRERVRERIEESLEGGLVQAGLYMLACERVFGRRAAGMFYCALRGEVSWHGWHTLQHSIGRSTRCTPEVLREVIDTAVTVSLEAAARIRDGVVEPAPRDMDRCRFCACLDICRLESAARAAAGGGSEE